MLCNKPGYCVCEYTHTEYPSFSNTRLARAHPPLTITPFRPLEQPPTQLSPSLPTTATLFSCSLDIAAATLLLLALPPTSPPPPRLRPPLPTGEARTAAPSVLAARPSALLATGYHLHPAPVWRPLASRASRPPHSQRVVAHLAAYWG